MNKEELKKEVMLLANLTRYGADLETELEKMLRRSELCKNVSDGQAAAAPTGRLPIGGVLDSYSWRYAVARSFEMGELEYVADQAVN